MMLLAYMLLETRSVTSNEGFITVEFYSQTYNRKCFFRMRNLTLVPNKIVSGSPRCFAEMPVGFKVTVLKTRGTVLTFTECI